MLINAYIHPTGFQSPGQQMSMHGTSPYTRVAHHPQQQQQQIPQQAPASSSLLLEFFNSYAYKQGSQSIPPPPGFQQATEQKRMNAPNVWSNDIEQTPGSADWMSLDPAIIFSKTSSDRINAEQQRNLRLGLEHHAFERNLFNQHNTLPINHQLLRYDSFTLIYYSYENCCPWNGVDE